MADEMDLEAMPLTSVLLEILNNNGWEDENPLIEDGKGSRLIKEIEINEVFYTLVIEANEATEEFFIYIYPTFNVGTEKLEELLGVINRINGGIFGRLACKKEDDENYLIQYRNYIDVEGGLLDVKTAQNMLAQAINVFEQHDLLAEVAHIDQATTPTHAKISESQHDGFKTIITEKPTSTPNFTKLTVETVVDEDSSNGKSLTEEPSSTSHESHHNNIGGIDLNGMPLTSVLQEWLNIQGWEDEIAVSDDKTSASISTMMLVQEENYRLFLEINEGHETVFVYFYTPFNVPIERLGKVLKIINRINFNIAGRFACMDDGEPQPIQYKDYVDVEGSSLSATQISNLVSGGHAACEEYHELISNAALTDQTREEKVANISVIGQTKVSTLQEGFLKEFGLTLRVYDGRSFADPSATLGQVRKSKGSGTGFSVAKNMKVGNLEDKFKEEFGLKVQVAGSDDSYLCDNALTLNAAQQKDEERLGRKARRQSKANDSGDGTGIDAETDTKDDGIASSSIDPKLILDWKAEGYKRKINPEEDAKAILSIEDPHDFTETIKYITEYCVEQSEGNIHGEFTRDKAYHHLLHVPEWEAAIRGNEEFEVWEEDGELEIIGYGETLPYILNQDEVKQFAFLFMTLIISGLDYDNETEDGSYPPYSNAIFEEQKAGLLVEMLEKLVGQYS